MRRCVAVFALLASFAWVGTAKAQELRIGLHAGMATPIGEYGEDFGPEAGGARFGFALGVDAMYPLVPLTDRLSWYSSASLIRNSTEGSQTRTGGFVDGSFTLVPVLTGLRYDLGDVPNLFVSGQAGPMFVRGPDDFYPYGFPGDPSIGVQLGYNVGIGLQLMEALSVGARYFPLGTLDFEYDDFDEPLQQEVDFVDIQAGVRVR